VELDEEAAQATFSDYRGAVEALLHRRGELERQIAAPIPTGNLAQCSASREARARSKA
jgi:hypothetical protein